MTVISKFGVSLEFANKDIRKAPKIALLAVKNSRYALKYVAPELV